MERIGFGGQPFLLYKHLDAAHDHVHIVTTNIKANGERISLHNIGKDKSEKARKEVEKMFGLVPAEANKQQQELWKLKPVAEKVIYGKIETKSAVSNTVRAVTRDYTFTSLAELNAILRGFHLTAYRGEESSKMYEKKGLTYSVIDKKGNRTGVPIKASSIYSKPTLKNLERLFIENSIKKGLKVLLTRYCIPVCKTGSLYSPHLKKKVLRSSFVKTEVWYMASPSLIRQLKQYSMAVCITILTEIYKNNKISKSHLASILKISTTAVDKNINKLKDLGILEREGNNKTGYWKIIRKQQLGW